MPAQYDREGSERELHSISKPQWQKLDGGERSW